MMFRPYPGGVSGLWMVFMMLAGAAGFCLLIWLILRPQSTYRRMLESQYSERSQPEPRRDDALELLRRRLASGEITTEEYDTIKAKLLEDSSR